MGSYAKEMEWAQGVRWGELGSFVNCTINGLQGHAKSRVVYVGVDKGEGVTQSWSRMQDFCVGTA